MTGRLGCAAERKRSVAARPIFVSAAVRPAQYQQVVENNSRNWRKFVSFSSRICGAFDV